MNVVTVIGARPQFIKCGPVSAELRTRYREVLVHTGQHYDDSMSERFFRELDLPRPDYHLGIGSGPHGAQTGAILAALENVLQKERPDVVLVYGDTNSTLAGALAAVKMHIPVAHVEAGLRSFNRRMPEEINRLLTDHVSTYLFCPTPTALANLAREGITQGVYHTGDVMYDAVLRYAFSPEESARWLASLQLAPRAYYLATIHRAENTDDPERLKALVEVLARLDLPVAFPVHPRTRKALASQGLTAGGSIRLLAPLGYREMLAAQQYARAVLTDSGGVQKEAFFLRTPCITLRDETEWVETVEAGWNVVVGTDAEAILRYSRTPPQGKQDAAFFGSGTASQAIVAALEAGCASR
jgi:UDP-N-acetylglucosamine 2-epimerase (non-hydrolysing)